MKRSFLVLIVALMVLRCTNKVYFTNNMSEADFVAKNKAAYIVGVEAGNNIYRVNKYTSDGRPAFFYFKNGVLSSMDQGQVRADLVIEKRSN